MGTSAKADFCHILLNRFAATLHLGKATFNGADKDIIKGTEAYQLGNTRSRTITEVKNVEHVLST